MSQTGKQLSQSSNPVDKPVVVKRRRWWHRNPERRGAWRDFSRGHEQEHR
jgi:hypothetical protein